MALLGKIDTFNHNLNVCEYNERVDLYFSYQYWCCKERLQYFEQSLGVALKPSWKFISSCFSVKQNCYWKF